LAGVVLLAVPQILFPTRTFEVSEVAAAGIDEDRIPEGMTLDGATQPDDAAPATVDADPDAGSDADNGSGQELDRSSGNSSPSINERPATGPYPPLLPPAAIALPQQPRQRRVVLMQGKISLNLYDHPFVGSPTADHVAVKLFDYTCPHCRELHKVYQQVLARYGDQFAIIELPVPLEKTCNRFIKNTHPKHQQACRYAQLALGVWHADPTKFVEFHEWMLETEEPPPLQDAAARAIQLVGRDPLKQSLASSAVKTRVHDYTTLYGALGDSFPFVLIGDLRINGVPRQASELFAILEQRLNLQPEVP
jgi:protein-disulfide isomerase